MISLLVAAVTTIALAVNKNIITPGTTPKSRHYQATEGVIVTYNCYCLRFGYKHFVIGGQSLLRVEYKGMGPHNFLINPDITFSYIFMQK